MQHLRHILRSPDNPNEWRTYHAIRRKVLFENRGLFGKYNDNHPDETSPDHHPLVLVHEGEPIGVIRVDVAKPVAWFRLVAIRDELQRRGHGRTLLHLAEAFARQQDCHEIRSNVYPDAVGFYEQCGYSRVSPTSDNTAFVPMTKTLSE